MSKNILISDLNHGGLTIFKEYSKYTNNNLFLYDTYNKLDETKKRELERKYHTHFLEIDEILSNEEEYITINPIHMKPLFHRDYTHHEFVGYLINKHKEKYGWNFKIIEVTGVKGKTTTTHIIDTVLKDKNRLVLTSNSLTYTTPDKKLVLEEDISITPASIITCLNKALKYDLLDKIEYCVFEVSLGVSSNCDVAVLTNIIEDYSIANSTTSASVAKESVFTAKHVVCDKKCYDTYYNNRIMDNISLVSIHDDNTCIYATSIEYGLYKTTFNLHYKNKEYPVTTFAPSEFYLENVLFSIATGLMAGISINQIICNLKELENVEGRGSYHYVDDILIIEDINSGLNTSSIKEVIQNVKRYTDNYFLIIGGDYGITCEEIDEDKLLDYIKTLSDTRIVFSGLVGFSLYEKLGDCKHLYFKKLSDAVDYLKNNEDMDIIQICYRSDYNRDVGENIV